MAEILGEDLAAWPENAWLVVDEYQEVTAARDAERFVAALIASSPLRLLVSSRTRPAWTTDRSLLYGEVAEIGQDELAMDPVEAGRAAICEWLQVVRRHPEIVRLIIHESVTPSSHLTYALDRFLPIGEYMKPLFDRLQAAGHLTAFDNRTFFLFLLTAGGAPFACPAVTAWVLETPAFDEAEQERHIDRLLAMLLPAR